MTDRFNFLTVALERDTREDDAEALISAIGQLKGVIGVTPNVADEEPWLAELRFRAEIGPQLLAILYPPQKDSSNG